MAIFVLRDNFPIHGTEPTPFSPFFSFHLSVMVSSLTNLAFLSLSHYIFAMTSCSALPHSHTHSIRAHGADMQHCVGRSSLLWIAYHYSGFAIRYAEEDGGEGRATGS